VFAFVSITANLLLQDTIERIHVGKEYGDIPRGIFIVRGENLVLIGEIVGLSLDIYCV
jgi:small nuclear ribonucleoprotein (snRNP)-like protein